MYLLTQEKKTTVAFGQKWKRRREGSHHKFISIKVNDRGDYRRTGGGGGGDHFTHNNSDLSSSSLAPPEWHPCSPHEQLELHSYAGQSCPKETGKKENKKLEKKVYEK